MSKETDARQHKAPEFHKYSRRTRPFKEGVRHHYTPDYDVRTRLSPPTKAIAGGGGTVTGIIGAVLFFGLLSFVGYALYRLVF